MERKWKVLIVVSLAPCMGFLDLTVVNVAFPAIERSYPETSIAALSWVLNAYNIVFAALLVASGRIADRFGRKRTYISGVAIFTAGSLLAALAPTAEALVAARATQGIGVAAVMPSSLGLLLREFPRSEQATAIGLMGAVAAVSSALGPTLGGLIVDNGGWRWAFVINLPIGFATVLASRKLLRESSNPEGGAIPDPLGVLMVTIGVALMALGLVKGEDWGWDSAAILGCFAAAVALGTLVVLRSRRHPHPVVELDLLRYRSFAIANIGVILFGAAFYGMLLVNILFLSNVWGYSALEAGAAWSPVAVTTAIAAGPAGRLADRHGHRSVIVPGSLLFAVALLWLALGTGSTPAFLTEWLPPAIVAGIGIALAFPTFSSATSAALPSARFATGNGVMGAARQLGAATGVAAVVAILGAPDGQSQLAVFDRAWAFVGGAALASALVATRLDRSIKPAAELGAVALQPALADATVSVAKARVPASTADRL